MADFISGDMYERMRGRWERAVAVHDYGAWLMGPPSWLVKERQRKGEDFLDAAVRVRKETWPDGWQGPKVAYFVGVNAPETSTELRQVAETSTRTSTSTLGTSTLAETTTETPTRLCFVCGGSMEGRRPQASVCSGACWAKRKRAKHG